MRSVAWIWPAARASRVSVPASVALTPSTGSMSALSPSHNRAGFSAEEILIPGIIVSALSDQLDSFLLDLNSFDIFVVQALQESERLPRLLWPLSFALA